MAERRCATEIESQDVMQEHAPVGHSAALSADAPAVRLGKRLRDSSPTSTVNAEQSADGGQGWHVLRNPANSTPAPRTALHPQFLNLHTAVSDTIHPFSYLIAGGQERRDKQSEALRRVANRLLPFPGGDFEPSPPPQLFDRITDELLVVSVETVEAVVSEQQPRPSGKAQFRLLAWVVADARGATMPLDKTLAVTVGKRLDRQAQKVRGDCAAVSAAAREARLQLSAATASDPAARRQGVAAIDAEEQSKLESLRAEVYVGFHELEALLPGAEKQKAEPAEPALAAAVQVATAALTQKPAPPALPAIPPELASRLGPEGVQYLWDFVHERRTFPRRGEDWYKCLPWVIQSILVDFSSLFNLQTEEDVWELIDAQQEQIRLQQEMNAVLRARVRQLELRYGVAGSDQLV